jgi:hypothetical protein
VEAVASNHPALNKLIFETIATALRIGIRSPKCYLYMLSPRKTKFVSNLLMLTLFAYNIKLICFVCPLGITKPIWSGEVAKSDGDSIIGVTAPSLL